MGLESFISVTVREFLQSVFSLPDAKRDLTRRITEFHEKHRFSNCLIPPSK
jgi:hypothetical protein